MANLTQSPERRAHLDKLKARRKFLSKVIKVNDCWHWTGYVTPSGYGVSCYKAKGIRAHRLAYILYKGEIPEKMLVLHKCDERKCVNPEHLFLGTDADNMLDCFLKGRHTNCFKPGTISNQRHLTDEQALEVHMMIKEFPGLQHRVAAKLLGIAEHIYKDIKAGRAYTNPDIIVTEKMGDAIRKVNRLVINHINNPTF